MSEVLPDTLDPYLVWLHVARAIERGCPQLRPTQGDPFVVDGSVPRPLIHRSYRCSPGEETYPTVGAPGDQVSCRRLVVIKLFHSYDPNSHDASWMLAGTDHKALLQMVLSRKEIFRIGQPFPVRSMPELKGSFIVQTLTIAVPYSTDLPNVE